jgi:superfamily II DNA/RNA helicase
MRAYRVRRRPARAATGRLAAGETPTLKLPRAAPAPRERHHPGYAQTRHRKAVIISTDNISTVADGTTRDDGTTVVTGPSPIDPDVAQTTIVDTDTHVAPTFAELGVSDEIVAALEADGKTHTFAIQELTLPLALAGDDLIGQARTGMGKTFGFGVPLLHRITQVKPGSDGPLRPLDGTPRALVIVPTRELCLQVTGDLQVAGKDIEVDPQPNPKRKLSIVSIYGGRPYESQIAELQAGADVVVGTPGRLLDLAQQGHLILGKVQILVLDEADEMLDLGFLPDIERIMRALPDQRQTMLFSATMPGPIVTLARTFLNRPTHIRAEHAGDSAVHDRTKQYAYRAHALDKAELVARVLQAEGRGATMIFTRTKRTAQKVADDLAERGFKVGAVHGDLGQVAREKALGRFRDGSIDVIVATDVAARGIDIDDVTHVINYQCPEDDKAYVHRIGRTGRAGRTGIAVTLVDWDELHKWKLIDDALHLGIPEPVETYSSSDHLRSDLSIPESATGRIAPPARAEREGSSDGGRREQRAPRADRKRRRTRGARSGGDGAAGAKPSSDASTDSSTPAAEKAEGDGSSRPKRRRRRGRGRGAGASAEAASAPAASDQ